MVKDHSDSERGNVLQPLYELLVLSCTVGSFICTIPETVQHILRSLLHQLWSPPWGIYPMTYRTMSERTLYISLPYDKHGFNTLYLWVCVFLSVRVSLCLRQGMIAMDLTKYNDLTQHEMIPAYVLEGWILQE